LAGAFLFDVVAANGLGVAARAEWVQGPTLLWSYATPVRLVASPLSSSGMPFSLPTSINGSKVDLLGRALCFGFGA
jgi:hypothetical protein